MMRTAYLALFTSLWLNAQTPAAKRYLLERTASRNWCSTPNETVWRDAAKTEEHGVRAAVVTYRNERPVSIQFFENAESGDWVVEDTYTLGAGGEIESLKRVTLAYRGEFIEEREYRVTDGTARLISERTLNPDRKEIPRQRELFDIPEVPVYKRIADLPFAKLITQKMITMETIEEPLPCVP